MTWITDNQAQHSSRPGLLACMAVALTVVLSACGSGGSDDSQVASISGKDSGAQSETASSTASADDSGRPQLRLDTSRAERRRLLKIWYACLAEHGHRMYGDNRSPKQKNLTPQDKAAKKACKGKDPKRPPQMVREKNPHYVDDYHAWIKCMHAKGMLVKPTKPFGSGWTYGPNSGSIPNDKQKKIVKQCKIEAFG